VVIGPSLIVNVLDNEAGKAYFGMPVGGELDGELPAWNHEQEASVDSLAISD
jgi:hypothetical protein